MALSSSLSCIKRYQVFSSFHGPDVRKGFLSHLHSVFASKGITTFNDQKIDRGQTIGPELIQGIREARVSIVVLSKKYASSSWCLDELVEILKCKEALGQIVMTVFYEVDPSDVKKQSGVFGEAFEKTCQGKNEEVKIRWRNALAHVATIAGEHSLNWDNEAKMIQKIVTDVSDKLNLTPSRDFEGMVGMEAHLKRLNSLLCLESDEVKMIGIWGPAGIGKTTIARTLFNKISSIFPFKCFMENLKGSIKGGAEHYSKLSLQKQLLSEILKQENMKIHHLGTIKQWLHDQKVLIILDDVDDLEQLEVLAEDPSWFGSGSRIIVTTEDKNILKAHRIQDIYHVDFPSEEEALEILCLSAFKQSSIPDGFEELANKVAELCGNLPLGLCVVGASLRRKSKNEWERLLSRIESSLDKNIDNILRIGYDRLSTEDQSLFLHIACFFNNEKVDYLTALLADRKLDVVNGFNILADRSLVRISTDGHVVMHHYLLQKLGRRIVHEQWPNEPGKRQFLIEAEEIRDVLTKGTGTESVKGISFDTSNIEEVSVGKGAFEGMRNLQFLRIYRDSFNSEGTLQIPEDMEYIPPVRLLHWQNYPRKSLPQRFNPEHLVKIRMPSSKLKKLWGGIQPLPNLKSIDMSFSYSLKEIPNLSKATNLEILSLEFCKSLVELPFSILNLHKLEILNVENCSMLKVIPTNINLASLERLDMTGCSELRTFPDISSNIKKLNLGDTMIEDVPPSVGCWSRLDHLYIGSRSLKRLHVPPCITSLVLWKSNIESIPESIIGLTRLDWLNVNSCRKLKSILGLPSSLQDLDANDCVSLKRVCFSFHNPIRALSFNNCLNLDEEARKGIIQQSVYRYICLPGKKIPEEFTHKATGRSITIPLSPGTLSASSRFKASILILPVESYETDDISCSLRTKGGVEVHCCELPYHFLLRSRSEHLFIFHGDLFPQGNKYHEVDVTMSEITFEFSHTKIGDKIIECGVQIMTEGAEGDSSRELDSFETESSSSQVDNFETGGNNNHHTDGNGDGNYQAEGFKFFQDENIKTSKHTGFRSWLRELGLKVKKMNSHGVS
ncbi:disease resistance protein-like [Arabidopsis thaliana]|uniref:ADP-ribosyl cyclase/cyclic ADP-ribose hydrolase n=3 Tax=Arabidopsis thaliana TaxID=3702 RepID=Q9LSX5_ARATH|nr:Disease resistance protein (TIR-NBS-LRR class) family [Arabidopsis thaliana]NP_851117.2 Disease resistance protein (TIR-NBS-LRR class) family [Arabidopsis thaliana]AED94720.1 Disease resistance protein (TIR-NBS-LRR class) family [Arabidopsis thaliana]AED94721.1 Disease resistance protein (TIR-NBS-LRR class) family [Arabidopsis thaliana]BAA97410.1 disease resistance protein-like [Arabidopsis thaliana]|eukprot:NP_198990.3 Disease resistance protein (TIR-NBS-LRR class) family [Arabidopsis thaliana]